MKKGLILLVMVLFCGIVLAQQETLLGSEKMESGGFGGPVLKFAQINKSLGIFIGGRGGWIINHSFVIGGGGYGLVSTNTAPAPADTMNLRVNYGGLELEYINRSNKLIHFTLMTLIGAGGINLDEKGEDEDDTEDDLYGYEAFFIFEPSFNVMVNVTSGFRFGLGVGYRFVSKFANDIYNRSSIDGLFCNLTFKFGHF